MPDYSLGRAHGKIEIDYDGSGADKAARGLDAVADSSQAADKSLGKTQRTLHDTERQMDSAGTAADGYKARLRDVESASEDVESAEKRLNNTLLDTRASLDDVKAATDDLTEKRKRHAAAIDAERAAHKALTDGMGAGQRAASLFAGIVPNLHASIERLSTVSEEAGNQSSGLASKLGTVAKVVAFLGPQGRAAAAGLTLLANGMDEAGSKASASSGLIGDFVKNIAAFEVGFGKISGLTLALPSLGGLAGLGGAASIQGIIGVADAVRDLVGGLGLLPAVISGVSFSSKALEVAFHGVDDALTDMMSDDPKKFLEDIKDMGPAAAQAMLGVAKFRDQFKASAGEVQDSFFRQVADDIAPLIQTWLPAVTSGASQVVGVFGQLADHVAKVLMQPASMQAFEQFVDNIAAGLTALQPAIAPLLSIFAQLSVVGSSVFKEIGDRISQMLGFFSDIVDKATASGELRQWIVNAVNGFGHLVNIMYSVTSAFNTIMDVAERFGGGGLLGWLEQIAEQLNQWTKSAEGQKALTDFFTAVRQATEAFLPMLGPLVQGLASIGTAFAQLGVATAPGWQDFFNMFAQSMADLGPTVVGMGPALNQFLHNMGVAMVNLVNQVGPQLPALFNMLSNAFSTLLPQVGPLVDVFLDLAMNVGPQLPKFFGAVTALIEALLPYFPILIDFVRNFVSVLTWFLERGASVLNWFAGFAKSVGDVASKIPDALGGVKDSITGFFSNLVNDAVEWGRKILSGLLDGLKDNALVKGLGGAAKSIVDEISSWFPHSPAKQGPFSGSGYTYVRGQKIVTDMAAGMTSARSVIESAASSTAEAASGALAGGAPAPGGRGTVGGALLPDNIAGADTSPLTAYLQHEFSDTRGLKGFAKDFGRILEVGQSGADLISQNLLQPLFEGLGMLPGADTQAWRKLDPKELAAKQQQDSRRKSLQQNKTDDKPNWQDVLGPGVSAGGSAQTVNGKPLPGGSVPLVQNPDGTWTSPNPAWAHLINRESSGMNQRQKISDVNSGGNEAEGLFQITPKTWAAHGGTEFAPNALAASVQEQAAIAARILQANPSGSDWGAGLPGRESAQELLAGLTGSAPAGTKGPAWSDVTGGPSTPSAGGTYGLPTGTDTGGYGTGNADTFPAWVMALAQRFGVKPSTYSGHQETDRHEAGYAPNPSHENRGIDWSGSVTQMQAFADYLSTIPGALEQVIWRNPETGRSVTMAGGKPVSGYYDESTLAGHENHVHTRQSAPIPLPGGGNAPVATTLVDQNGNVLATVPPSASATEVRDQNGNVLATVPPGAAAGSGLTLPSGQSLDGLLDETKQNTSVNDQLLQAYLQGNPALAQQISTATAPGASDGSVLDTLTSIDSTINQLTAQDAVGNKNTIDALRNQQSTIAQQGGFTQTQNGLQQAQSIASAASGAIGGVFKAAQSGLDALAATQDIADRLVYGVRNTEDISKIVDNVQKYITFAADVLSAAGSIVSMAGQFTGGSDMGGVGAAGSALSLISSVMQGVNAAIDFGQQIYEVTMGYVGRFMSILTGLGGTDLMGNVGFLLNKNTGQLISYSHDNPEAKNTANVPSWMKSWYDYNGRGNYDPGRNTQLNIFAGPGQSPAQMMNETMWLVNTGGTTGALAAASF